MSIKKNIDPHSARGAQEDRRQTVAQKLDELIRLLGETELNRDEATQYKEQFDNAIQKHISTEEQIKAYEQLDNPEMSRMDMLDEMTRLLSVTELDNKSARAYLKKEWASKTVVFLIGLTLIALGFAMIVLPAPESFEIYTLFYLTANDGITIMDVISLLIILAGVFLAITALKRKNI